MSRFLPLSFSTSDHLIWELGETEQANVKLYYDREREDTVELIIIIKLTKHSWYNMIVMWLWCDNVMWCYSQDRKNNFNDKLKILFWKMSQIIKI